MIKDINFKNERNHPPAASRPSSGWTTTSMSVYSHNAFRVFLNITYLSLQKFSGNKAADK